MAVETDPVRNPGLGSVLKETEQVDERMKQYAKHFQANDPETTERRVAEAVEISNKFHTLATDFYEYGFGESFHFCPLFRGRPFEECMAEWELYMAEKANAGSGKKLAVSRVMVYLAIDLKACIQVAILCNCHFADIINQSGRYTL